MIRAHVLLWVRCRPLWVWRQLTFAQYRALPRVGRKALMAKTWGLSLLFSCAGGFGVLIPPALDALIPPSVPAPWVEPVSVPEPGALSLLVIELGGLVLVRRRG